MNAISSSLWSFFLWQEVGISKCEIFWLCLDGRKESVLIRSGLTNFAFLNSLLELEIKIQLQTLLNKQNMFETRCITWIVIKCNLHISTADLPTYKIYYIFTLKSNTRWKYFTLRTQFPIAWKSLGPEEPDHSKTKAMERGAWGRQQNEAGEYQGDIAWMTLRLSRAREVY
jgi:hypothetical protein